MQKERNKQEKPTCTLVLALPNSRDGPTTAMPPPWFGLFPGVCFSPGCVIWAWQMHTGAQHPEHCTVQQQWLQRESEKDYCSLIKTEFLPGTQLGDGEREAVAKV